ncbi:MAG: hypothetical protein OHK0045_04440 [Raineya sp.]
MFACRILKPKYMQLSKVFHLSRVFFAAVCCLLTACGEADNNGKEKKDTTRQKAKDEVIRNVSEAVKQLPRVQELPDLLASAGIDDFYENLINPTKNTDKYLTTNDLSAINFGIYAIDLGYVLNYEKIQLGSEYMQSCKKLADKIGVTSAIEKETIERFGKNLDKKDTLIKIANETVQNIDKYLRANQRASISAVILGAMFVEALHISTSIISMPTEYDKNTKDQIFGRMVKIIVDQEKSLDDAINSLETVQLDSKGKELLEGLKSIKKIYTEKKYTEKFATYQGGNVPVSTEDLKPLLAEVKKVRNSLLQ